MKKLKLELDSLTVASFATAAADPDRGTVDGHFVPTNPWCAANTYKKLLPGHPLHLPAAAVLRRADPAANEKTASARVSGGRRFHHPLARVSRCGAEGGRPGSGAATRRRGRAGPR